MGLALPNPRYERKFIADGLSLAEAIALVRRHPGAFHEAYPPRTINNVYFDSPLRSAYYDHINGAPNRIKHRIRWYGALQGPISQAVIERKLKSGAVSGKDAHGLGPVYLNGEPIGTILRSALQQAGLPERLKAEARHLDPCLINRYRRHYFVSADGRFRLTVDSDFQFGPANLPLTRVFGGFSDMPSVVLEVKYRIEHAAHAGPITNALPMRMTRCSKFILGMERV